MHLHTGRRTTLMRSGHQERNLRTSVKKSVQVIPENHIGDLAASSISGKQNTVAAAALIAAGVGAGALAVNKLFGAGSRPYEANVGNEYDAWTSEGILEYFWGEHIHLGYYSKEELAKGWKKKDFIEAKYDFIEEMFKWSGSTAPKKILDVGCGIGGTSRYLAKRFPDAEVIGITISAKQVERATQLAKEQGVGNVQFQLVDALDMSFEDNQFDLVWGCESGEHMPDKKKYVEEMTRVLAPNGHLAIATWCQRHATPDNPLNDKEKEELQFLYDEWAHPYFISIKDYEDILQGTGQFESVGTDDWTTETIASWRHSVWVGVLDPWPVVRKGPVYWYKTLREIITLERMHQAFAGELMQYGMIKGSKKSSTAAAAVSSEILASQD